MKNNARRKKIIIAISLAITVSAGSVIALAQDLNESLIKSNVVTENLGATYEIKETDAIEAIQKKLKSMEASGELEALKQKALGRMEDQILEPESVKGISTVDKAGVRYFDPTFVLGEDILDHEDNVIAAKGTRVNPLDVLPIHKKLFFFDGRSDAQVEMAIKLAKKYGNDFTPILTAGSWVDTSEKLQQAVYFDQQGKMTTRLTVTSVPSLVLQEGKLMRIEEMKP